MDPRMELRGAEEVRAARAAYHKLHALVENLPSAFHQMDRPDTEGANAIEALCSTGFSEELRDLRAAVAACCEHANEFEIRYKWPNESGLPRETTHSIRFWSHSVKDAAQRLDEVLAPLPSAAKAYAKLCRLADELESAARECPTDAYGRKPHVYAKSYHDAKHDFFTRAQRELAEARSALATAAHNALFHSKLDGADGWLSNVEHAWAKVPKLQNAPRKPKKSRSKEPLGDRVKVAMFGLHKDGKDYTKKAAVAERMGVSKSLLNKPEADRAFAATLKLLSNSPKHTAEASQSSTQIRLQGEKARAEIHDED